MNYAIAPLVAALSVSVLFACSNDPDLPTSGGQGGRDSGGASGQGDAGGDTSSASGGESQGGMDGSMTDPRLDDFADDAARAICDNLFRCCAGADVDTYLAGWANSDIALDDAGFPDIAPPNVSVTSSAECQDLVSQMIPVAPFGDWIEAAKMGDATFRADELDICIASLNDASCGESFWNALLDSTCLNYGAPQNPEMRKVFVAEKEIGSCTPIRDGVGARFYGTCDRSTSYCCYENPTVPGRCVFPFDGDGNPRTGICIPAVDTGQSCRIAFNDVDLCHNGATCGSDSETCVAVGTANLQEGDTCYDTAEDVYLGTCPDGQGCDEQSVCAPLKADGVSCSFGFECLGGACSAGGTCEASTFCSGM